MIEAALTAIKESDELGIADGGFSGTLSGFSGERLVGALQRLTSLRPENECYVEVGVFQGLTLLSTAYANSPIDCYGIDNFAFFDKGGKNFGIVKDRRERLGLTNAHVINMGFEEAFENLDAHTNGKKIGVYFVDGPHDYRSQLVCLLLAKPYLAPGSAILIDDSNYSHVRQANFDFLKSHPEFKLAFESYTERHPMNMNAAEEKSARKGWWNGINIMLHDPEDKLERIFPATDSDRTPFENDHLIHCDRGASVATEAVEAAQSVFRPTTIPRKFGKLAFKLIEARREMAKLDATGNTYSPGKAVKRIASLI